MASPNRRYVVAQGVRDRTTAVVLKPNGEVLWRFVLGLILVRITLDNFKVGTSESDGLGPGPIAGIAFLVLSVLWLAGLDRSARRPLSLPSKIMVGLALWAYLAAAFSDHRVQAATSATKLFAGIMMFVVLEQLLPNRPDRVRQLLAAVVISAAVPSAIGLYQGLTGSGDTIDTPGFNRVYGTSVTPVSFASYLVIILVVCIAMALRGRRRKLYLVLSGVTGVLIFWTYTRSAWLVAVVGAVLLVARLRRYLLAPAVAGVVVLAVRSPEVAARFSDLTTQRAYNPYAADAAANSLSWRFEYWHQVVGLSAGHRATGVGLDVVPLLTKIGLKPHNLFIQSFVELGAVGLGIMIVLLVVLGANLRRRGKSARTPFEKLTAKLAVAVAVCIFIEAQTTNPLTSTLLWWYMAAAMTWGFTSIEASATELGGSRGSVQADSVAQPRIRASRYRSGVRTQARGMERRSVGPSRIATERRRPL